MESSSSLKEVIEAIGPVAGDPGFGANHHTVCLPAIAAATLVIPPRSEAVTSKLDIPGKRLLEYLSFDVNNALTE